MHMSDALLSPAVGITFWAISGAALAHGARKIKKGLDDHRVPLMGVLGAFIFAAQMVNFTIPGTGSSGHLGGGLLLSLLLGPGAGFLTISSVLVIQALFFADGGLLALGANIFNLGAFPCLLGLALFRLFAGKAPSPARLTAAAVGAAVVGLELGAMSVVLETLLSGRSEFAFVPFAALMAGIHLPIGIVEGFVTAAVLGYILKIRPELAPQALGTVSSSAAPRRGLTPVLAGFVVAALVAGGFSAWFASTLPDGLEWSIGRVSQDGELAPPEHGTSPPGTAPAGTAAGGDGPVAGIAGAILTLAVAAALGFVLTKRKKTGASA